MRSMSYCRHEMAARELAGVWDLWDDYEEGSSLTEDRARERIKQLVVEMADSMGDDEDV